MHTVREMGRVLDADTAKKLLIQKGYDKRIQPCYSLNNSLVTVTGVAGISAGVFGSLFGVFLQKSIANYYRLSHVDYNVLLSVVIVVSGLAGTILGCTIFMAALTHDLMEYKRAEEIHENQKKAWKILSRYEDGCSRSPLTGKDSLKLLKVIEEPLWEDFINEMDRPQLIYIISHGTEEMQKYALQRQPALTTPLHKLRKIKKILLSAIENVSNNF